jgi:hypothetical protein
MMQKELFHKQKYSLLIYSAAFLISLVLTLRFAREIFALPNADLIAWDQAARADEAVRLAKEGYYFQIDKFIIHVFSLNWWPPLLPLILFPFILILGPSFPALVIPSFIAFPFVVVSLLFLYKNLDEKETKNKILGGSIVFALALTSPLLLSSSSWVMLEIYGVLLTYLGFGFYFQARHRDRIISYKICAICVFLLWTLKYNYGLFASLALLFFEVYRNRAWLRHQLFSPRTLRVLGRPIFFPAYALLFLILVIVLTHGRTIHLLDFRLAVQNIYNPLMFLYQYLFIISIIMFKKKWPEIKSYLKAGQKELLLWAALPVGIFMALPDKIKAIIKNFEAGRRLESRLSFEPFLFYLRSIGKDYSLFFSIGILTVVLLMIGLLRIKKAPLGIKFLLLFFSLGYISLSLTFNLLESRYIVTFIPCLWIISAWVIDFILGPLPHKHKIALALVIILGACSLSFFSPLLINKAKEQPCGRHDPIFRKFIDPVIQISEKAQYVLISGTEDLGFHLLLKWKLEVNHFKQKFFKLDLDQMTTEAFQNLIAQAKIDTVVLFIVERSKRKTLFRTWQEIILSSKNYKFAGDEYHKEPEPLHILFFKKVM